MSKYYLHADRFFLPSSVETGGYLAVEDGVFGAYTQEKPVGEILDYTGKWIAPGLVDTHIHGYHGHDVMDHDGPGGAQAVRHQERGRRGFGTRSEEHTV